MRIINGVWELITKLSITRYLVGGAVRDIFLGKPSIDKDWVVVDQTEEDMIRLGFIRIGKSSTCPVFIHPADPNKEEHALPRRDVSTGPGHQDFTYDTENVDLEDDLKRRDFTINAMLAHVNPDGVLGVLDPFGGHNDVESKIIKHVDNDTFVEDPLRVMRAARFAARFSFTIHPKTVELCRSMCEDGMLHSLSGERIFGELKKAIEQTRGIDFGFQNYLLTLLQIGALKVVLPEIYNMIGVLQPQEHHKEGDVFQHTLMALEEAISPDRSQGCSTESILAILFHDIGKTITNKYDWPSHLKHDGQAAVEMMEDIADRLKMDKLTKTLCINAVKLHMKYHMIDVMSPGKVLKILKQLKAKHTNSANAESFIVVGYCDEMGRLPRKESEALSTLHKWSVIVKEFRKFKVVPRNLSTQVARQMDVMQQEVLMVKSVLKRLRGH